MQHISRWAEDLILLNGEIWIRVTRRRIFHQQLSDAPEEEF